ncbi:MAG: DsrE family protein [Paludibacterium sp.]|uniref:DsrE/DsrF/TusD sulfur relay family protein n=1 Tax=Paludibacterium sp. TaxID=1917523 RepID=UPI0025E7EEC8|nr:DsrE family protein [Paludibacterium sp.]MBV8048470.1 DsrE family protein [Paludibacterium sp.]MBV8646263.1 DsrE family protein [Paludibacterium sp.]
MQNIVFTLNASPYGSERTLSGLRLALALTDTAAKPRITVFLLSDAVVTALAGQTVASGATLGEMVQELLAASATVKVCRTCTAARGIGEAQLIAGVGIGTMPELAELTLAADKVLSF